MNRKEFKIVSVDGSPEVEALLKSDSLIHGSVAQNPYAMAMKATDIGSNIVKSGTMPDTSTILLDPILVTRENVASYKGWGAH